jgi:uncharacterized protein YdeI (YjbR/CyaY-like superfamily)
MAGPVTNLGYHRREHLTEVAREPYSHGEGQQKAWMKVHQMRLPDKGKIKNLDSALRTSDSHHPEVVETIPSDAELFERKPKRMQYPKFRRQHLIIGSGTIEAGCKRAMASPLKRSGMIWTVPGANAILTLRCSHLHGRFEDYSGQRRAVDCHFYVAHPTRNRLRSAPAGRRNWHNRCGSPSLTLMKKPVAKVFQATLERFDSPLKWVMIRIPFDAAKIWGRGGQLKVKGEINGFAFRTSLFPRRGGGHMMLVNKQMQRQAGARAGTVAKFRLEPDTEEHRITMPVELKRALAEDRSLRRWFDKLNRSTRNESCKWIVQVQSAEARARRAAQLAERLLATMEAERELPPILQVAFAHNSQAREGWERMSPSHRRGHLLGIFYYRSPEARSRRVEKAVREAAQYRQRTASKGIHRRNM